MKKAVVKTPKVRLKIPGLAMDQSRVMRGITAGLTSELAGYTRVSLANVRITETPDKKPIGAGRGGKYYSENRSHYSRF